MNAKTLRSVHYARSAAGVAQDAAGSHYMAQGTDVLKEWCEDDTGVTRNKLCTVREIAESTG